MRARKNKSKAFSGYNRRQYTPEQKAAFKLQTKKNLEAFYQNTATHALTLIKEGPKEVGPASLSLPYNPATGTVFKKTNSWVLSQHMRENNLSDPRFVKGYQLSRLGEGLHILKDEKGIHILEPRKIVRPAPGETSEELDAEGLSPEDQDAIFESTTGRDVFMFRPYSVFHASQIKNMPPLQNQSGHDTLQKSQLAERLVKACGINLTFGADKPGYITHSDTIQMPGKRQFESTDAYAAALLKQWYVATGAQAREGRFKGPSRISEGLLNQAAESLRTQAFCLGVSQTFGLPYQLSVDPIHVKCWEKQLKEDPQHIVRQAAYATNLVNTAVEFAKGVQPQAEWFPDVSSWPSEDSDLDEQLNASTAQEEAIVEQIREIVSSAGKGFSFDVERDGAMQFVCDRHRDAGTQSAGEEDIAAAFELRQALMDEFSGLEVNVLEENGRVYLSVGSDPSEDLAPEL